jgi:hypothetical protein
MGFIRLLGFSQIAKFTAMITNALLLALYGIISLLLTPIKILGDVSLDSNVHNSILTARTYLANMNIVLPVGTILAILGIILTIETFILLYKAVNWLIRKIPTID